MRTDTSCLGPYTAHGSGPLNVGWWMGKESFTLGCGPTNHRPPGAWTHGPAPRRGPVTYCRWPWQPRPQLVAHVLRRTTFGPYPGQVEAYLRKGPRKTIAAMLARDPLPTSSHPDLTNDDSSDPVKWWLS